MAPKSSNKLNQAKIDVNKDYDNRTAIDNTGSENDNSNSHHVDELQVAGKVSDSSRGSPTGEPLRKLLDSVVASNKPGATIKASSAPDQMNNGHHKEHILLKQHEQESKSNYSKNKDHLKKEQQNHTNSEHHKRQKGADTTKPPSQQSHGYNAKLIAEPLVAIAEHHHYHKLPIRGQMNDSRIRIESLHSQAGEHTSRYPIEESYSDRLVGYAFLLGLPLLACLIIMILMLMIFKHCRQLGEDSKIYKSSGSKSNSNNKSRSGKQRSGVGGGSEKQPVDGKCSSIGFISGSKVINGLKGVSIIGGGAGEKSDSKQLTLNMEEGTEGADKGFVSSGRMKIFNAGRQKIKYYGKLNYRIGYDFNESMFSVTILRADNLPAMDLNGYSDPYVKVYLTPEKRNYHKTRIHRKSLNPTFDETFQFRISYATLMSQTLVMAVYDYDRFSKHDEIGQVAVPISSIDLAQMYENWSELKRIVDCNNGQLGDICLSLRYVPTAGKLTIVIMEARKLKKMDMAGLSDPYVKLALMSQGKRLKKKKTSIKKCTLNPHYNESFSFEIAFEEIKKVQLVLTVVDYDRIGTSEPIGKVVLGCDGTSGDSEMRHWMDMLACPRRPIAQWHSLKALNYDASTSEASS